MKGMVLYQGCLDWPLDPACISPLLSHGPVALEHKDLLMQASPSCSQATVLRSLFTQAPWPPFQYLCESENCGPMSLSVHGSHRGHGVLGVEQDQERWLAGERGESCFLCFPHIGRVPMSAHASLLCRFWLRVGLHARRFFLVGS